MIDEILQSLQARLNEDLKDTEEIYKILEDDSISYERRLKATTLMFQLHGKTDRLRYAIGLIKDLVEQEKLFNQATNQQYSREKHIVYTQNKIDNEIVETTEKCNCEKNHDKIKHTKEDDEEFEKIKIICEQLKPYLKEEQKAVIDNYNDWYEKPIRDILPLKDYKMYMKSIVVLIIKTEYEKKNEIYPLLEKLSQLIRTKE